MASGTGVAMAAYLLVTVLGSGEVRTSPQSDAHACDEARSVALYGTTVEDDAADAKAAEVRRVADERAWEASHPPRLPRDDGERSLVEAWMKGDVLWTPGYRFSPPDMIKETNLSLTPGPTYSSAKGEWASTHNGRWKVNGPGSVAVAICAPADGTSVARQ